MPTDQWWRNADHLFDELQRILWPRFDGYIDEIPDQEEPDDPFDTETKRSISTAFDRYIAIRQLLLKNYSHKRAVRVCRVQYNYSEKVHRFLREVHANSPK